MPFPGDPRNVEIASVNGVGDVPVHLVRDAHAFGRENVYGEPDDLARYQVFSRVIIEMLRQDEWKPDTVSRHRVLQGRGKR